MKPSCLKLWSTFLNIITLGISTTKDSVYCSISKGFHETPSIEILSICYSLQFGIPLACIIAIGMRKIINRFILSWRVKVENAQSDNEKNILLNKNKKKLSSIVFALFLVSLFMGSFNFIDFFLIVYENKAISNYKQTLSICKPYMKESDVILVEAKFAHIKNKSNYVNVIAKLDSIAKTNNDSVPIFNIW
jgi:hypothetical protein